MERRMSATLRPAPTPLDSEPSGTNKLPDKIGRKRRRMERGRPQLAMMAHCSNIPDFHSEFSLFGPTDLGWFR